MRWKGAAFGYQVVVRLARVSPVWVVWVEHLVGNLGSIGKPLAIDGPARETSPMGCESFTAEILGATNGVETTIRTRAALTVLASDELFRLERRGLGGEGFSGAIDVVMAVAARQCLVCHGEKNEQDHKTLHRKEMNSVACDDDNK